MSMNFRSLLEVKGCPKCSCNNHNLHPLAYKLMHWLRLNFSSFYHFQPSNVGSSVVSLIRVPNHLAIGVSGNSGCQSNHRNIRHPLWNSIFCCHAHPENVCMSPSRAVCHHSSPASSFVGTCFKSLDRFLRQMCTRL